VSRHITNADQTHCEFSLAVADDQSGHGIGTRLMLSTSGRRARPPRHQRGGSFFSSTMRSRDTSM
jgi:hypothetical protein